MNEWKWQWSTWSEFVCKKTVWKKKLQNADGAESKTHIKRSIDLVIRQHLVIRRTEFLGGRFTATTWLDYSTCLDPGRTHVLQTAPEVNRGHDEVWVAERHEGLCQLIHPGGSLLHKFRTIRQNTVDIAGIFLTVTDVHRLNQDPTGFGCDNKAILPPSHALLEAGRGRAAGIDGLRRRNQSTPWSICSGNENRVKIVYSISRMFQ